jgi:hypothetical protein
MKTWKKKLAVGLLAFSLGTFIGVKQVFPTVSDTDTQTITANGNGVTVNYTIGFTFLDNDDVRVYLEATNVTPHTRTLLTYGTGASQYTITGGDPGTTVHMITAPTTNQRLVILRDTPLTQAVDYIETEAFPAADHEEAMDKLTLQTQELDFKVDTKIGLAAGSTATVPTFPDPPAANGFLTYSSAGVVSTTATTGVVSAIGGLLAANNLSDLTSVSTALANLGISSTNSLPVLGSNGEVLTIAGGALDYAQITNTNVAAAAAIDYSKLNLTGAVLNGDLAGSIADGKLATSYIKADGTRALTGNWNVGAFNITASSFIGSLSGNATTATSLAANPAACPGGQFVTDTAADGTLTCSTPAGAGDVVGPSASVDSEFAIYNSTTGKLLKRASGTGIAMGTSGVASFLSGATAGQVPMANGTTFVATTLTQPYTHFNCGLGASISGNTVVIDLKQSDGSTAPSSSAPCIVGFRSATATSGAVQSVSFTAANQITVGASASLGHTSMTGANVYVYLIQDTTSEICVSNSPFLANDRVHSAVATPSTTGGTLYCTNTHTSRPTHLLGVVKATYSGPNWSLITNVSVAPFASFDETAMTFVGNWQGSHTYNGGETLLIDTEEQDDFGQFFGNTFTVQIPSICTASINAAFGSMDGVTDGSLTVNICGAGRQCYGSRTMSNGTASPIVADCTSSRRCAAGDTITGTATGDASYTLDNNGNRTKMAVMCVPYAQ